MRARVLFYFLLLSPVAQAQTDYDYREVPVDERYVFFLYTEFGLPATDDLKVVVFSSHIYRCRYQTKVKGTYDQSFDDHHEYAKTLMHLAFSEKIDEIERNEYNSAATLTVNQVHSRGIEDEWAYAGATSAEATGPELYLTLKSPTQLLVKVREKIISQYQEKGYKVFQVAFDEYYDESKQGFMKLEQIEKLPTTWISPYRSGVIRAFAKKFQEKKKEEPEPKKEKKSTPQYNSACYTRQGAIEIAYGEAQRGFNTTDMTKWNDVKQQCEQYFYYCGQENFSVNAIYNEANNRINKINQMTGEAVIGLMSGIFTDHTIYGLGYSGFKYDYDTYDPTAFTKFTLHLGSILKLGAIVGDIGYVETPNYVVGTYEGGENGSLVRTDTLRQNGLWLSFGFGPGLALFDGHLIINVTGELVGMFLGTNFEDEDGLESFIHFKSALIIRFGEIGIGVDYNFYNWDLFSTYKKKGDILEFNYENTASGSTFVKNRKEMLVPYTFGNDFGVRLMFNLTIRE